MAAFENWAMSQNHVIVALLRLCTNWPIWEKSSENLSTGPAHRSPSSTTSSPSRPTKGIVPSLLCWSWLSVSSPPVSVSAAVPTLPHLAQQHTLGTGASSRSPMLMEAQRCCRKSAARGVRARFTTEGRGEAVTSSTLSLNRCTFSRKTSGDSSASTEDPKDTKSSCSSCGKQCHVVHRQQRSAKICLTEQHTSSLKMISHLPVAPSLCRWGDHRPGTRPHLLYQAQPGRHISSWPAPLPTSESTEWRCVGPASGDPHNRPSPVPAVPRAHTPEHSTRRVCFPGTMICYSSHVDLFPHLCPSALREFGQQSWRGLFFSDERCLQVIYGVSLVLPDSQTQAADQLSILDAVHVQRLPVVLLTGRRPRLAVTLVLR